VNEKLPNNEIIGRILKKQFDDIDVNKNGQLSKQELLDALARLFFLQ
jgi:hypothetical protein